MNSYVATYNDSAIKRLRGVGVYVRKNKLTFFEEDISRARAFFRLYVRNFMGVRLSDAEFSVYEVPESPPSRMGFLDVPEAAQ